ncbi:aminotransferase class I/II-fold pyridoxal phosphate-dependent enzyme [Virgibacillus sp. SK37]|uniref:aminotransferase class I/II-fold pyridoxal phosphate-dependent enzyme n=1 Tax=Virgibacillus sp. SK37 TaxID=403957 RepID=UPI0004D1E4F9|nr:aminotransferase class I/II-fold pyridoxal phosphate-dependent enzyme [Virgibacillus sp. SK37]AIF41967.1 arginine decarboxylase [Virgibacillus sp. SK37]
MDQRKTPIYQALINHTEKKPLSLHVPGHKNGEIFPDFAKKYFQPLLHIDMTELSGLDDLHAPSGIIAEAEVLAANFFQADKTFFLVGGSTVGNLAMILATCSAGERVIVQRNSHKSIMNGLELSGAHPVFITPEYDDELERYTQPSVATLREAIQAYPNAKAVLLTYPDYYGNTYDLPSMVKEAHAYNIPVLVDEAHGVHFSLGTPFPPSALEAGADVVVQSAHKMAPAMTMSSYLHMKTERLAESRIAHYLQVLQSSSPSYPLMASLDLARGFLATLRTEEKIKIIQQSSEVEHLLNESEYWEVRKGQDPLKLTLHVKQFASANEIAKLFEMEGIYPELVTHNQLLFVLGLKPFEHLDRLKKAVKRINDQLKNSHKHDTIEIAKLFPKKIEELALSYNEMKQQDSEKMPYAKALGYIAAEAVIPYPPGIPLILKGQRITESQVSAMEELVKQGVKIQLRDPSGIRVFTCTDEGEETT